MGFLGIAAGVIVALLGICFVIGVVKGATEPPGGSLTLMDNEGRTTVLNPAQHSFRGRVLQTMEQMDDGTEIEVFDFQIKGVIAADADMWTACMRVGAVDVTEDKDDPFPVLCAIDDLQAEDSCIFEYRSSPQPLGEITYIENWTTLFKVPIDAMRFAKRGRRILCFFFGAVEAQAQDSVQAYDEIEFEYDSREPGYVDMADIQREIDELTVQLAVLVSAADGVLDECEGAAVQNWIKKRLALEDDLATAQDLKNGLNGAIAEAAKLTDDPAAHVATLCKRIVAKGAQAHRYDALELCLEVAGADGSAEQTELDMIEGIAKNLRVDAGRLKEMVQKALPVGIMSDKDPDAILGIEPGMPPEQIKKILAQEYKKWNSRVSHSDRKVREQASEMLALIADARKRHIG